MPPPRGGKGAGKGARSGGKGKAKGGKGKGKGKGRPPGRKVKPKGRGKTEVDDVSLASGDGASVDGGDRVLPGDDESIPDDEAFDSEDERKWGDLFSSKPKGGEKGKGPQKKGKGQKKGAPAADEDGILPSDAEIPSDDDSESSDAGGDTINLSDLLDDRKGQPRQHTRKRGTKLQTETAAEGAHAVSSLRSVEPLSLDSLINKTMATTGGLKRVKHKLERLQQGSGAQVDLPEETAEQAARERAITRQRVEKDFTGWQPTVTDMRKKEVQNFPLKDAHPAPAPTTSKMAGETKPQTEMEKEIAGILQESGLRGKAEKPEQVDPQSYMRLEEKVFDYVGEDKPEDKQGVVAKLKSVLHYEHAKRRHMKNIKSKAYRRMLRKEKEKQKEKRLELLAMVDPEAALKKRRDELLKARAQERMGQRHKNKSQWIKHVKQMAKWDPNVRAAMGEQNSIHRKLMSKMDESAEVAGGYVSDDEASESESRDRQIDSLVSGGDAAAKSQLWNLRKDIEKGADEAKKGVWGMKFMQKAAEKRKQDLLDEVDEAEKDIDRMNGNDGHSTDPGEDGDGKQGAEEEVDPEAALPAGVMKFEGPREGRMAERPAADTPGPSKRKRRVSTAEAPAVELGGVEDAVRTERRARRQERLSRPAPAKRPRAAPDAASAPAAAPAAAPRGGPPPEQPPPPKRPRKGAAAPAAASPAAAAAASPAAAPAAAEDGAGQGAPASKRRKKGKKSAAPADDAGDVLETTDGIRLDQDYLVARAFAEDTLAAEFAQEKSAVVDKDVAPLDEALALPGWGEWGGQDPKLGQRQKRKWREMEQAREEEVKKMRAKRKDAKLMNVILNEDEDTLPEKYRVSRLPFPYRTNDQYEATLATPIGPDWQTEARTRVMVRPQTLVKTGTIINPIERQQGKKKVAATKWRRKRKTDGGDADSD